MTITVQQNVTKVTITASQSGNSTIVQPVICKNGDAFDGTINGGTP